MEKILDEVGASEIPSCIVLNKIDAAEPVSLARAISLTGGVPISAIKRTGFDQLILEIKRVLWGDADKEEGNG